MFEQIYESGNIIIPDIIKNMDLDNIKNFNYIHTTPAQGYCFYDHINDITIVAYSSSEVRIYFCREYHSNNTPCQFKYMYSKFIKNIYSELYKFIK